MSKQTEQAVVKAAMRLNNSWDGKVILKTQTSNTYVFIGAGKRVMSAIKFLIRASRAHAKAIGRK